MSRALVQANGDRAVRHAVSRIAAVVAVGMLGLLLGAPQALGHAAFLGSDPAPGVRLEASPSQVTLMFTEPLNRKLASAELVHVGGGPVKTRVRATSGRRLVLRPVAELARGAYRITWHSVSTQDGHALEGTFSFGVRAAAAGGGHAIVQSPLARNGWARVAGRVLLYVALLLFAGALVLRVVLGGADGSWLTGGAPAGVDARDLQRVRSRERAVTNDLGVFAVGAAVLAALLEAVDAARGLSAQGVSDYLLGNVAGAGRLAVVVCTLLALALWTRRQRLAAACAVLALGAVAASGHAGSATPRAPSIVNDWVHLLSAAVWLGGIALIVIVWGPSIRGGDRRELRQQVARSVLPRFGRVALPAFALVISTGAVSVLVQLGQLSDLWSTAYGRVLAVKIAFVGVIALLSCWHARRLAPQIPEDAESDRRRRRQWRVLHAQPLLGIAAVAAVAVLATFPLPPRQLQDADAVAAVPACDPCPLPRPASDELAVADDAGGYVVAGWLRRDDDQVRGTIRVLNRQSRPADVAFTVQGARQRSCTAGCRRFSVAGDTVVVSLVDGGRRRTVRLPARWEPANERRARGLLLRVQQRMRSLRSLRQSETVTSGPGTFARTNFRLRAPDRLAYRTDRGIENVVIGRQRWFRAPDVPWQREPFGSGIAFSTRSWFRWTSYAQEVRLLRTWRDAGGRRFAQLALMDPGTPVWLRLTVGLDDLLVRREKLTAAARYMDTTYSSFNAPVRITSPRIQR